LKSYVLTPAAIQDLQSIQAFIARDNPGAARKVLQALRVAMRALAKRPGIGHVREDLADPSHRFFLVYSFFIVYISGTKPLQVVRVVHSARDVEALLGTSSEDA
jgi:plasmid stabilization system protein ParE